MIKFDVKNRWTGKVQFTAEIDANEDAPFNFKLGLAIKWAINNNTNLRGAYLGDVNLRDANLRDAYLGGAYLRGADLGGADLRDANLGGADLGGAYLGDAYLGDANLRDAYLGGADLRGAYLGGANLGGADLRGADLRGSNLRGANLRDANLRDAYLGGAYLGDVPDCLRIKNIHQTVYTAASKKGALDMDNWHTCETTHCRAGWVIHLTGDAGKTLEWAMGTPSAAAIIYILSDPDLKKIPDFYASNEDALADMKDLAEKEMRDGN